MFISLKIQDKCVTATDPSYQHIGRYPGELQLIRSFSIFRQQDITPGGI